MCVVYSVQLPRHLTFGGDERVVLVGSDFVAGVVERCVQLRRLGVQVRVLLLVPVILGTCLPILAFVVNVQLAFRYGVCVFVCT